MFEVNQEGQFTGISELNQGLPTTVFCKISVQGSKYCLEFSIQLLKFSTIFWSLIVSHFIPEVMLFLVEKGNLKFSDADRNQKNSHIRKRINFIAFI